MRRWRLRCDNAPRRHIGRRQLGSFGRTYRSSIRRRRIRVVMIWRSTHSRSRIRKGMVLVHMLMLPRHHALVSLVGLFTQKLRQRRRLRFSALGMRRSLLGRGLLSFSRLRLCTFRFLFPLLGGCRFLLWFRCLRGIAHHGVDPLQPHGAARPSHGQSPNIPFVLGSLGGCFQPNVARLHHFTPARRQRDVRWRRRCAPRQTEIITEGRFGKVLFVHVVTAAAAAQIQFGRRLGGFESKGRSHGRKVAHGFARWRVHHHPET